jgi:hypothetical protein
VHDAVKRLTDRHVASQSDDRFLVQPCAIESSQDVSVGNNPIMDELVRLGDRAQAAANEHVAPTDGKSLVPVVIAGVAIGIMGMVWWKGRRQLDDLGATGPCHFNVTLEQDAMSATPDTKTLRRVPFHELEFQVAKMLRGKGMAALVKVEKWCQVPEAQAPFPQADETYATKRWFCDVAYGKDKIACAIPGDPKSYWTFRPSKARRKIRVQHSKTMLGPSRTSLAGRR